MTAPRGHSARAGPALRALAEADPALAALSLWCAHRDGTTTRTDGSTITYGPEFRDLALHEQIGLAAHHILHVALRHPARLGGLRARLGAAFDADLYNLAADALVNEALLLADHALPRPAVTLTGLLAEALDETLSPEMALATWDVDRLYHALSARTDGTGGAGRAADTPDTGASDDAAGKARRYARDQGFDPDLQVPEGGESDDRDTEQAARWRQHMARAMAAGQAAGRGIGRFGHRIADRPEPRTAWETLLRRSLARALTTQPRPSPHRPSRRWIAGAAQAGLTDGPTPGFEPGQRPFSTVPRIAIGLDASGSIDDARLALFWSELSGIARRLRAELHLMIFDDEIRVRSRLDPTEDRFRMPDLPRGGGTAFIPVVQEALAIHASTLVVLTDLDGEPGPAPRGLPVIWALPDAGARQPPYGRLIDLSH